MEKEEIPGRYPAPSFGVRASLCVGRRPANVVGEASKRGRDKLQRVSEKSCDDSSVPFRPKTREMHILPRLL